MAMTIARFASAETKADELETGLALSAGSAAGLAHVGVLSALEAEGIRVDAIAGTSMGAVIGGLYASGYRADEIEQVVRSVDWQEVFSRKPERTLVPLAQRLDLVPAVGRVGLKAGGIELPSAIQSDYRVNRLLIKLLTVPSLSARGNFDLLPIPFRAVAADLATGERVIFDRGNLARAVRASMAIPVLLPPVEDRDRTLVDGGIADDFPVGVAREMGGDYVIGVDARLPPKPPEEYRDAVGMAVKVAEVLARAHSQTFFEPPDLLIAPNLEGTNATDYDDYARIIELGRKAAIAPLAASPSRLRGQSPVDSIAALPQTVTIDEVQVDGNRSARDELIRETFGIHPSDRPIAIDQLLRGMDALYATRLFDSIWVDFTPVGTDRVRTTVEVKETWPWALEGGVSYTDADQLGAFGRLRNRNLFGFGENLAVTGAASDSELRACAQLASHRLFTPAIGYYARTWLWEDKPRLFVANDPAGRADFDRLGIAAGLQRPYGPSVLLRLGGAVERVETDAQADALIAGSRERILSVNALLAWDRLDDLSFPSAGSTTMLSGSSGAVRDLETDRSSDYWRIAASGRLAQSLGERTVLELGLLAGTSGGEVPEHELFRIGGPTVPGLYREELWNRQAAAGEISTRRLVWRNLHATVQAGAGSAWTDWDAATFESLHWGFGVALEMPTLVGPVSLMWGRGDGHDSRIYFTVGYRQYPMSWLGDDG